MDSNCKTYHDNLSLNLRNIFLLPPIFYSFIFLSQLVLAYFDTLKLFYDIFMMLLWLSMLLMIVYWSCECFLNMLMFFLFFSFSIFVSSVDIGIIWFFIIGLCFYYIDWTRFVSSTFTVYNVVFRGGMFVSSMISCI